MTYVPPDIDGSPGSPEHWWWRLVATAVGLGLWGQLSWSPLAVEWQSQSPGTLFVLLYLLPGAVVCLAALVRHPFLSLFAVPTSLLPGLVAAPNQDLVSFAQPFDAVLLAVSVLGYLASASFRYNGVERLLWDTDDDSGGGERIEGTYRGYTTVRIAALVLLFALLTHAIFLDPELTRRLVEHHDSGAEAARIFIATCLFFAWCIAGYTMFLLPLSNLEYDVRSLHRRMRTWREDASSVYWRLGGWVALAALGGGLLLATTVYAGG